MMAKILLINNLYTESENLRIACRNAQLPFDEVRHTDIADSVLTHDDYIGVVLSGTGDSPDEKLHVYDDELALLARLKCPVLGICGGAQILTLGNGGDVSATHAPIAGRKQVNITSDDPLFTGLPKPFTVFSKHRRYISTPPNGYDTLAREVKDDFPYVLRKTNTSVYAVQFHPERRQDGTALMLNFFQICRDWGQSQGKEVPSFLEAAE